MVGQGVVMCCKAEGQPDPLKYTWLNQNINQVLLKMFAINLI